MNEKDITDLHLDKVCTNTLLDQFVINLASSIYLAIYINIFYINILYKYIYFILFKYIKLKITK